MKIFEVKNNLVKIFYDSTDNLFLSSFVMIKDSTESYIGQVMHLKSNKHGNLAVLKLIFNVTNEGIITNYKGSIPTIKSTVTSINYTDFLKLIEGKHPIIVGESIEAKAQLILDKSLLENKLVICCEKQPTADLLIKRLNEQIKQYRKKTVILDIDGEIEFTNNILTATENFKLPINYNLLDYIYTKATELTDNAKSQAIIQEVIMELQYYTKTIPDKFIPINYFIDLLETQYSETGIHELVLLKNEILKYNEAGIFAQDKKEFQNLIPSLIQDETTVINLAYIDEDIQKEYISYIYSIMQELNSDFYVFLKLGNHNSTKKLLKQIYSAPKINTSIICSYSYKYLIELKKISKNLILFTPILQQQDFASYNIFLNKLGKNEFIIYGKTTQYIPLIAKISSMKGTFTKGLTQEPLEETEFQMQEQMKSYLKQQEYEKQKKAEEEKLKQQTEEQAQIQQQMLMQQFMQQQMQQQQMQQQMQQQALMQNYMPQAFMPMTQMPALMPNYMAQQPYVQMSPIMPHQTILQPQTQKPEPDLQVPELQVIEPQTMPIETSSKEIKPKPQPQLTEEDLDLIEDVDLYNEEESTPDLEPQKSPVQEAFERQGIDDLIDSEAAQEIEDEDISDIETETFNEESDDNILELSKKTDDFENTDEGEILPMNMAANPILPIYSEDEDDKIENIEETETDITFQKGDRVLHEKFGTGTIEKIINYGSKPLYSIYFEQVGRRLLDPKVSNLTRAD